MSEKRLEKIQQKDLIQAISDGFLFGKDGLKTENIFRDVEWLIQQAKRVEELEKQNKRYREALKFYADENIYDGIEVEIDTIDSLGTPIFDLTGVLIDDNGETARKALEGEE